MINFCKNQLRDTWSISPGCVLDAVFILSYPGYQFEIATFTSGCFSHLKFVHSMLHKQSAENSNKSYLQTFHVICPNKVLMGPKPWIISSRIFPGIFQLYHVEPLEIHELYRILKGEVVKTP